MTDTVLIITICISVLFVGAIGFANTTYSIGYRRAEQDFLESPCVFASFAAKQRDSGYINPVHTDLAVNEAINSGHFVDSGK